MNKSIVNKLLLARSLYHLAKENSKASGGVKLSICCNLLQDSVETFLLAISEHVNADVGGKTDFDKYFELINRKIAPVELPFRSRLIALNKLRVNSKHYGLEPSKAELEPLFITALEFFNEVALRILGKEFSTISMVDLIKKGEVAELLTASQAAYDAQEYAQVLISCRKIMFLIFEQSYDAYPFVNGAYGGLLGAIGSKVPYYARDKVYLEKHIKEPTDYVVYDHSTMEMDLLKFGIDSTDYWNVWRLTPEVYRKNLKSEWVVKNDFRKLDVDGIKERAEYVLFATTEILLEREKLVSKTRQTEYREFFIYLARDQVPIYSKASKNSSIVCNSPQGVMQLNVDFSVTGLDDGSIFWHVFDASGDSVLKGFVHEDIIAQ